MRCGFIGSFRREFPGTAMNVLTPVKRTLTIGRDRTARNRKIMKTLLNSTKWFSLLGLWLLAAGCATTKHTETYLTAAGFQVVMVTTPKQEQKLQSLPPGKITPVQRNGKKYYVFPDAAHHRIYLGTANEYQNYRQILADNQIAEQDRMSAEMADTDGDDWNEWGSWEIITFAPN
jgi:hypothetical protein